MCVQSDCLKPEMPLRVLSSTRHQQQVEGEAARGRKRKHSCIQEKTGGVHPSFSPRRGKRKELFIN